MAEQQRLLPEIKRQIKRRNQQRAHLPQPQLETLLTDNISAREMRILEAIFTAELEHRLPAQFFGKTAKSRMLERLQQRGMIAPMVVRFGGALPVRVEGWELTHYGRMTYCASC